MIVVADSGPLHYLILLERADLLRRLYGEVIIPEDVAGELRAVGAPPLVREWMSAPPPWLAIVVVADEDVSSVPDELDAGERAAIALAEKIRAISPDRRNSGTCGSEKAKSARDRNSGRAAYGGRCAIDRCEWRTRPAAVHEFLCGRRALEEGIRHLDA